MALKQIKSKIKSTQRTSKVTKAMEAVSAVKMRKSQERALGGRPYAEAALRILDNIARSMDARVHNAFVQNRGTKDVVIVVTSDKGLAGGLNSSVLKEAAALVNTFNKDTTEIICFGKKSYEYFLRRGYTIPQHYLNVSDDVQLDDMNRVVDHILREYAEHSYRSVFVVYQNFVSTFEQKPVMRQLLPVHIDTIRAIVDDIVPKHVGENSPLPSHDTHVAYTIEPNTEAVFNATLPLVFNVMLYHALLESKASEHSARMVAMKNATDKAKEITRSLTLLFNKKRQSVITAEVSEITGGIEAMQKK